MRQYASGAITYVGEDTGWTPPNGEKPEEVTAVVDVDVEETAVDKNKTLDIQLL